MRTARKLSHFVYGWSDLAIHSAIPKTRLDLTYFSILAAATAIAHLSDHARRSRWLIHELCVGHSRLLFVLVLLACWSSIDSARNAHSSPILFLSHSIEIFALDWFMRTMAESLAAIGWVDSQHSIESIPLLSWKCHARLWIELALNIELTRREAAVFLLDSFAAAARERVVNFVIW